ncbi:MAG: type II toxin-antitoxin system HicA family toxin [Anaerolineae bacterium]|nr:type II toxin-antitoxin system HicA family toxin [Anaerolineae bacterium]
MTRRQKLYQRLLNHQKNVRFDELISVVEAFGFELDRIKGSHRVYKHPAVPDDFLVLLPDKNGQAKPYQIKQFLGLVEQYNLSMTGKEEEDGNRE